MKQMNMKLFLEEKYRDWLQKLTLVDLQRKRSCEDSNENKILKVKEGKIKKLFGCHEKLSGRLSRHSRKKQKILIAYVYRVFFRFVIDWYTCASNFMVFGII